MCFKCEKQGHYANECKEENTDDEDDNMKKNLSNKKGSNFINQGQYEKTKSGRNEDNGSDDSDKEVESSDDDYKFTFLQDDVTCSIQDKVASPKMWIFLEPYIAYKHSTI